MKKIIVQYLNNDINYKNLKKYFENNYVTLKDLENIELYLKDLEKEKIFKEILDVYLNVLITKNNINLIYILEVLNKFNVKLSNLLAIKIISQHSLLGGFYELMDEVPKHFEDNYNILKKCYNLYIHGYNHQIENLKQIYASVKSDGFVDIRYYKNQVSKIPVLTPNEEISLFIKKELGYPDAFEYLLLSNLRLVLYIANDMCYKDNTLSFEDLVQNGNIALMKAIYSYKFEYGNRFSTYAFNTIRNNIKRQLPNEHLINVSTYLKHNSTKPEVLNAKESIISLDDSYYKDSSNDSMKLVDEISNEMCIYGGIKATDIEALDNVFSEEFNELFDNRYYLSELDKKILYLHLGCGYSVNECIKILDLKISRQAVDQRVERAKTKLKNDRDVRKFYNSI